MLLTLGVFLTAAFLVLPARPGRTVAVLPVRSVPPAGAVGVPNPIVKNALAETFIVPTGGMAETVLGHHKVVPCPKCRHAFPLNASREVQPPPGFPSFKVDHAVCPNCRYEIAFRDHKLDPRLQRGDGVLVGKGLLGARLLPPGRLDLAAFYYPPHAVAAKGPTTVYLKRLVGLPGETLAVHYGNLWTSSALKYEGRPRPAKTEELWQSTYTYADDEEAVKLLRAGGFQILRKPPELMLALRRLVHDNEYSNPDGSRRWVPEKPSNGWTADGAGHPRRFTYSGRPGADPAWLRYRHLLEKDGKPGLITDFLGYNTYSRGVPENWVGDLMLECDVTVDQARGRLVLELARGAERFQARFALDTGACVLVRLHERGEEELARKDTALRAGTHRLRFGNFDERLTLWVGDALPFGEGVAYPSPKEHGPTAHDLQPVGLAVQGGTLSVSRLQVWRDTYYTADTGATDAREKWQADDPATWNALRGLSPRTFFVHPDHYFMLGDNSPESADSRMWGSVPRRLLLGKVFWRYSPPGRAGVVR